MEKKNDLVSNDDGLSFSSGYDSKINLENVKKRRKTQHFIINVPVQQLKKIGKNDGISSLSKETQQFVGLDNFYSLIYLFET